MMKIRKGFTLTELAVAIAFISILLLTIATVTLNMVQTYHKGNTMKAINTVGLELISEFTDAISASNNFNYQSYCSMFTDATSKAACEEDKGQKFIFQEKTTKVVINNTSVAISEAQTYGIFCTGKYTYVWNTGYTYNLNKNNTKSSKLYNILDDEGTKKPVPGISDETFKLRKYQDQTRSMCMDSFYTTTAENGRQFTNEYSTIEDINFSGASVLSDELIITQDLAIFSLKIDRPIVEPSSHDALYTGHLVLGSISGGIDTSRDDPACNMETSSSYDIEYCATNKFNFTMKTNGGGSV